jgi:filamentous hemagglutinin
MPLMPGAGLEMLEWEINALGVAEGVAALTRLGATVAKKGGAALLEKSIGTAGSGATKSAGELLGPPSLVTDANSAYFWSGLGKTGATDAASIAASQGGTTLESLAASRGIVLPAWDASNPSVVAVWQDASRMLAQGVSGDVKVVLGSNLRPGNIWEAAELPALQANPNVTRIIQVDPITKAETVIFTKAPQTVTNSALVDPAVVANLQASGVKITPQNVVATGKNAAGQTVFLETGNSASGLTHIVQEHAADFAKIGIPESQIPETVTKAVTEGKFVGYQGAGTGRPIYEVTINGKTQRIAVTVGDNGYIVGANPASSPGK